MSHQDVIKKIPRGFKSVGYSSNSKFAIIANEKLKYYGVQFHPEVSHTVNGKILLKNFLFYVCKVKKKWRINSEKNRLIKEIKETVKKDNVICAL